MRYLVAYPIPSPVREKHMRLVEEVANRFGITPEYGKIEPHLTLKTPFDEIDPTRIEELHILLERFAESHTPTAIRLSGYGTFRRDVVYAKVEPTEALDVFSGEFTLALRSLTWLPLSSHDVARVLHATIAREEIGHVFDELWAYVQAKEFEHHFLLDRIALYTRRGTAWQRNYEYIFQKKA